MSYITIWPEVYNLWTSGDYQRTR